MDEPRTPFDGPEFSGKNESATGEPSSATGVFGKVSSPVPRQEQEDILASLSRKPEAAIPFAPSASAAPSASPAVPSVAPAAPGSAGPGEFTRMLESLKQPSSPNPAQNLAGVFKQVSVEKPRTPEGQTAPFAMPAQRPRSETPVPSQSPAVAAPAAPAQSFTQVFSLLRSTPPVGAPPSASLGETTAAPGLVSGLTPPAPQQAATGPGEFTRMFQAVQRPGSAPVPAAPPEAPAKTEPGSFTQVFSKPTPPPAPAEPFRPPLSAAITPEPIAEKDFSFYGAPAPARPAEPALSAQGGFTQLFQALNKEEVKPPRAEAPLAPAPPPPAAAAGGFTKLYETLSPQQTAPPPVALPIPVSPMSVPPMSSGPGEFTRIISGSALREGMGQGAAPVAPAAAAPAAGPAFPAFAPPAAPPLRPPAMPPMGAPHAAPPAFAFPPPPAAQPPAPAPAQSALQKYLPLILLVNVFLLLVIVLVLIFVLRHH